MRKARKSLKKLRGIVRESVKLRKEAKRKRNVGNARVGEIKARIRLLK